MLRKSALILLLVTFVISCKLFQKKDHWDYSDTFYADSTAAPGYYEGEEWTGYNEILYKNYKPSATKIWDLVHTELSLQFDFAERSALGEAELTLHPHWDWQDSLVLDAKGMRIKE